MKTAVLSSPIIRILGVFFIFSLFIGCEMEQKVTIDAEGRGELSFEVELADYLTTVIEQMEALAGPAEAEEAGAADIEAVKADLDQRPELDVLSLNNPDEQHWNGALKFSDIESLLADAELPPGTESIFTFTKRPAYSRLELNINMETIEYILEANPSLDSPLMQAFGPLANVGLTDTDYLDMMEFALGPESRDGIRNSSLDLLIEVDGEVLKQEGGEMVNGSTVRFSIPLLDILIIEESLTYSVEFK